MKNRSAKEILRFTFAHLDTIVREKRNGPGKVRDRAKGWAVHLKQEDSAAPESVAGKQIRGERQ